MANTYTKTVKLELEVYVGSNKLPFPPHSPYQTRELKLADFQLRILCEEWGKLDQDATYLVPVQHFPLLWQKVSCRGRTRDPSAKSMETLLVPKLEARRLSALTNGAAVIFWARQRKRR